MLRTVTDKDLASAMMAIELGADLFLISTAVGRARLNYREAEPGLAGWADLSRRPAARWRKAVFLRALRGPKSKPSFRT